MYANAGPTTPFIPPHPGGSPAANAPVIPPTPSQHPGQHAQPAWGQPAASAPGTPWAGVGWGTPYPGRGRRNSYNGMPVAGGGPPFDAGAYFGYPASPAMGGYPAATPAAGRGLGLDPWTAPGYGMGMGMDQQHFLHPGGYVPPPPHGQQAPVIPSFPTRSRSHSRSRSRGPGPHYNSDGLPDDWIGPRPGQPQGTVPVQPVPVPPEFAAHVPPGTPWYPLPHQIPHAGYAGYGYPPPRSAHGHARQRSAHTTPWIGGGYLPEEGEYPYERANRPEYRLGMVDTRWFTGKDYGPILDPLLAGIIGCAFKVNPLLSPPPDDPAKRPYLSWNMLFQPAYVHRSDERANQSWMKGRNAPATFPRLSHIRIISRSFPWFIDVRPNTSSSRYRAESGGGVNCGDVIDTLYAFFLERIGAEDYHALPAADQTRVAAAYHYNRSMAEDVPGGRLDQGMLRVDFLGANTMWGGLEVDQNYVAERLQISGRPKRETHNVFVLVCDQRLPLTQEERREQAARGASVSRAASANG